MTKDGVTRRGGALGLMAVGIAAAQPAWAQADATTGPVEIRSGRVRGKRANGVSKFLGIPYGADTSAHRFQPALPAPAWTGVRDCFDYGASAYQAGGFGAPRPARRTMIFNTPSRVVSDPDRDVRAFFTA